MVHKITLVSRFGTFSIQEKEMTEKYPLVNFCTSDQANAVLVSIRDFL